MRISRWMVLFLLTLAGWALTGCATDDPDNVSARPWNAPQDWENGMPPGFYEHR